jgi:gluconokinase
MTVFVLMGVSGSGKSTIGRCVAESLALPFIEGDDFHPSANVAKMASGIPLDDGDRVAWIDALMQAVNARPEDDVIVACSALTYSVRTQIQTVSKRTVVFLHLSADPGEIEARLRTRGQHFMKAGMLSSQLAALQPSTEAIPIDATRPFTDVCASVQAQIVEQLSGSPSVRTTSD